MLDVSGKILGLMAAHRRDKMPLFIGKRMSVYIFAKKREKKNAQLLIPFEILIKRGNTDTLGSLLFG